MIVYAVVGDALEVFIRREDAERFIEEAATISNSRDTARIEEREPAG